MVITVEAHKIAYMALPKSCCTSIKIALATIDPEIGARNQTTLNTDKIHRIYRTMRFRPHRFAEYSDWWKFCVIRDPIKRLMSVYSNRVIDQQDLRRSRVLRDGGSELPLLPDPDFFFQNLKRYQQAASVIKHHSLPAQLFIGSDLSLYDKVYPVEDLPMLAKDLSSVSGTEVAIPKTNSSSSRLDFSALQPRTQAVVLDYLDDEIKLLSNYY